MKTTATKVDEKGNWVAKNDKRSSFESVGESPNVRGKYGTKEYKTGDFKKKSWWGNKDYGSPQYAGNTDGSRFQQQSRLSNKSAREGGTAAALTGQLRNRHLRHQCRPRVRKLDREVLQRRSREPPRGFPQLGGTPDPHCGAVEGDSGSLSGVPEPPLRPLAPGFPTTVFSAFPNATDALPERTTAKPAAGPAHTGSPETCGTDCRSRAEPGTFINNRTSRSSCFSLEIHATASFSASIPPTGVSTRIWPSVVGIGVDHHVKNRADGAGDPPRSAASAPSGTDVHGGPPP